MAAKLGGLVVYEVGVRQAMAIDWFDASGATRRCTWRLGSWDCRRDTCKRRRTQPSSTMCRSPCDVRNNTTTFSCLAILSTITVHNITFEKVAARLKFRYGCNAYLFTCFRSPVRINGRPYFSLCFFYFSPFL